MPLPQYKNGAAATRYAADHGADVINMSFVEDPSADTCAAIHYAVEKGAVVVAGVGNDGVAKKNYPAACPGAIGVGAVDQFGEPDEANNSNSTLDLLAPGVKVPVAMGKSDSTTAPPTAAPPPPRTSPRPPPSSSRSSPTSPPARSPTVW